MCGYFALGGVNSEVLIMLEILSENFTLILRTPINERIKIKKREGLRGTTERTGFTSDFFRTVRY